MNPMNLLFLFMLGESAGAGPGKDVLQRAIPAMAPGLPGIMAATVFAKKARQIQEKADKDQEDANKDIVVEVVTNGGIGDEDALRGKFPKVHEHAFLKLPEAEQDKIFTTTRGGSRASRKP